MPIDLLPTYMGVSGAVTAEGIGFGKLRLGSARFSRDRRPFRGDGYVGIDLPQVRRDKGPAWRREPLTSGPYAEFPHADGRPTRRCLGAHSAYRVGRLSADLGPTADGRGKACLMLTPPVGNVAGVGK